MRKLRYILFLLFFSPSLVFAAFAVMLENPPTLYFSKANVLSLKKVENIIIDAVERSSSPQVIWSIESKKPNVVTAKFIAKGKHTAFVNINYDKNKVQIKYKDSHNLKHKRVNNLIDMIHPNYHVWVNYMVQKIKFSSQKIAEISLQKSNPAPLNSTKGKGHLSVIIAAQAEPGKRDDDYELSFTMEKFSATLLKQLSSSLVEITNDNVTIHSIAWGDMTENLIKESYKKEVSKNLCNSYKADKILYANAPAKPGGQGSRDIMYYLYDCSSNRKINKKYEIDREEQDTYGYQFALIGTTGDFIENNIMNK